MIHITRALSRPGWRGAGLLVISIATLSHVAWAAHHEEQDDLARTLASAGRPAEDVARDAGRKPGAVLTFFGVEPGMTAVDLIAAGGYYTEVLSVAVGPKGKVHAQNNAFSLQIRDGANEKAISGRLANGRLPNVERLDREIAELGLEASAFELEATSDVLANPKDHHTQGVFAEGLRGNTDRFVMLLRKPGGAK